MVKLSAPHTKPGLVRNLHIDHLMTQQEHLLLVRDRHVQWMGEAENAGIRAKHKEIVALLEEASSEYADLIVMLKEQEG